MRQLFPIPTLLLASVSIAPVSMSMGQCPKQWVTQYGVSTLNLGQVRAMHVYDDGKGPALYAGGTFTQAGGLSSAGLARWDGVSWSLFGQPADTVEVSALGDFDGKLIVAGAFTRIGNESFARIAAWDGTQWHTLGSGMNAPVHAIVTYDNQLYAGGMFNSAGGLATPGGLARWNGQAWHPAAPTGISSVASLDIIGDELIINGGTVSRSGQWVPLGSGGIQGIFDVAEYQGTIFSAGMTTIGHQVVQRLVGTQWQPLPGGELIGWGYTLAVHEGQLLIGGQLLKLNGGEVPGLRFDGAHLFSTDPRPFGSAFISRAMCEYEGRMVVGGQMYGISGGTSDSIAELDALGYLALGRGFSAPVRDLAIHQGRPVAVGDFTTVDRQRAGGAAMFTEGRWRPLGDGPGMKGRTIASDGDRIAVGGAPALGLGSDRVELWDGTMWTAIGEFDDDVLALAWYAGDLYAAGTFDAVNGQPLARLARWDGTQWSTVGAAPNNDVSALLVHDGRLIAGGWFTEIGGVASARAAAWDGEAWTSLGSGLNGVLDLAVHNGGLVAACGNGGVRSHDGVQWNAMGPSSFHARAVASVGGDVVVGGRITSGVGSAIRRFQNGIWQPIEQGVTWHIITSDPGVYTLMTEGDVLHVGGNFAFAGGKPASFWARHGEVAPEVLVQPRSVEDPEIDAAFFIHATGSGTLEYQWRRNGALLDDGLAPSGATISGATTRRLLIAGATPADAGQYDAVVSSACGQTITDPAMLSFSSACYANCDHSTTPPLLNVDDFTCFINEFAAASMLPGAQQVAHYANCDHSTVSPVLNIDDFTCFINHYAQGCR